MMDKTIIKFNINGCMGEIHETEYPKYCDGKMFYKVKVLKDNKGYESRDGKEEKIELVPSWYLQNIGGDFYCIYG